MLLLAALLAGATPQLSCTTSLLSAELSPTPTWAELGIASRSKRREVQERYLTAFKQAANRFCRDDPRLRAKLQGVTKLVLLYEGAGVPRLFERRGNVLVFGYTIQTGRGPPYSVWKEGFECFVRPSRACDERGI